jgi:hypothetical protein
MAAIISFPLFLSGGENAMRNDIYLQCFRNGQPAGWPVPALLLLFPIQTRESRPGSWHIRYDERNSCDIAVFPFPANGAFIESLCIHRPCSDSRLWQALFTLLRIGNVVLYSSGDLPPLVAEETALAHLPPGMIESLGPPVCVHSAQESQQAVVYGE